MFAKTGLPLTPRRVRLSGMSAIGIDGQHAAAITACPRAHRWEQLLPDL